jgi:hypothetical protein
MKKAIMPIVLGLMLVLTLAAVSASVSTTVIAGKIYNSDYTATVPQANVKVTCGGNEITLLSDNDGSYKVKYEGLCVVDDELIVYAEKNGLTGTKTGVIKASGACPTGQDEQGRDYNCLIEVVSGVDVAVVNVPLVPEFGTVVGILTALGALGVFFVVRKK